MNFCCSVMVSVLSGSEFQCFIILKRMSICKSLLALMVLNDCFAVEMPSVMQNWLKIFDGHG